MIWRGKRSGDLRCRWILIWIVTWSLASGTPVAAQAESTLNHDFRLWSPVYLTVPLSSSFLGYMEVNPRFGDNVSELDQLFFRPALGYKVTNRLSVWQGYAWIGSYQPRFTGEHRSFQQLIYNRKFSFFKLLSRSRLEQRVIDRADGVAVRARTMLRGDFPIPQAPDWALVVYDEVFVNVNTTTNGPQAGLDQNRIFLGLNRKVTNHISMDMGYQLQALNTAKSGLINQLNHIMLLQFFINL